MPVPGEPWGYGPISHRQSLSLLPPRPFLARIAPVASLTCPAARPTCMETSGSCRQPISTATASPGIRRCRGSPAHPARTTTSPGWMMRRQ
jgi:hypothetical protein